MPFFLESLAANHKVKIDHASARRVNPLTIDGVPDLVDGLYHSSNAMNIRNCYGIRQ